MSDDLSRFGVLNENYRISAAFTRELIRGRKPIAPTAVFPSSVNGDAEQTEETGLTRPGPKQPPNSPPPSGA
jgi:hypothetical protein